MRLLAVLAIASVAVGCGRASLDDGSMGGFVSEAGGTDGMATAKSDATTAIDSSESGDDAGPTEVTDDGGPTTVELEAGAPSACNPFTCTDGCCLGDGGCFRGIGPDVPCGSNGEACLACPSGWTCVIGTCARDLGETCTPANCDGCCVAADIVTANGGHQTGTTCFVGSQDMDCGSGGGQCRTCVPSESGGHCVGNSTGGGGHCEGAGTCDSTNCAGCCSGNLCVVGSQDVACGQNGGACQDCTADAGVCYRQGTRDGGSAVGCGYACSPSGFPCAVFCSSPTDCVGANGVPQ